MAGHLVALAPDLGGRRFEGHQPLAHRVEPGPVGQGGATVAELLDRGVVLLHDEKLVEGGHGGVPPGGVAPGSTVGAGGMTGGGTWLERVGGLVTVLGGV